MFTHVGITQNHNPSVQKNDVRQGLVETRQSSAEISKLRQQLGQAKNHLFTEHIDSANLVTKALLEELSTRNLLKSPLGLEARLVHANTLELGNARGEALEVIFSLIGDCKDQKEWLTLSRIYLVAELAYEFLGKPERCLFYLNECKALMQEHSLERMYPRLCIRFSTYHRLWGDRDSAYYYGEEALRSSQLFYEAQGAHFSRQKYEDFTQVYAAAHTLIGGLYGGKGELDKCKYHLEQAKYVWQRVDNKFTLNYTYLYLSGVYIGKKDYAKALLYSDTCLLFGKAIYDDWDILGKDLQSRTLLDRARIFKALNQKDSAYQCLQQGYVAQIDVIHARNHLYATEIETRHTDQQKALKIDQQNEQLDREQKRRWALTGMITVLFLLAAGLIYFYLRLRKVSNKTKIQAEELKQLDKVKSKFFANISHELRTPLTLILGPLSYILEDPDEWEKENIQKQLLVMQRNGRSLMELVEEILDLSKLEANKLELTEEVTPVIQFFEQLFFVFEPQFQSQNLNYDLNLEVYEDLNVMMDRKKMEKVLKNILSNAIKFTPNNGKIVLSVNETENQLKIQVSDSGKGIHSKDLPYIFDRFYQSKQADQKLFGGTGIGLALVSEFAQLMGGTVYAESTLGAGSRFYLNIPKKKVKQKEILVQSIIELPEEEIYSIGMDFTILVVEDNDDMRNFVLKLLQEKYKRILLAKNGIEGLEMMKEYSEGIHLVVSDVMMPEMDGIDMLKELKSNPTWNGIPVVMLTALAAERDKLKALTLGVDDYLTKPFSVPELLIRVQNLLFNYHQRLEWQKSDEFQKEIQEVSKVDQSQININDAKETDKKWVEELIDCIESSFAEVSLDVESLAASVFLSSRQLSRRLKAITGLSPGRFIREVQLQAARKILERGSYISISEVAYRVGFENQSSFSRIFKNRFGKSPSEISILS